MAGSVSPATGRRYGVARVCKVWDVARSSFYAAREATAADALRDFAAEINRLMAPN